MGYQEGLLGGFLGRKREVEQENIRQSDLAQQREGKIFEALLSSPDPEIQAMAASGLLESAQPRKRKGGLRGWVGEMQTSPTFQKIQGLINTPVETQPAGPPELAHTDYSGGVSGQIATPPSALGEAPMGTPAQSLTEPGAAKAQMPAPVPKQISAKVGTPPVMGPRRVFATPEDLAIQSARGKAAGDVEGDIQGYVSAGMSKEAATAQVRAERLRAGNAGAGAQSIAGEVVGPDGRTTPAFGVFDRASRQYFDPDTQKPIPNFRPRTTTGSTSMGADREAIARELFGLPFAQLNQTQQANVNNTAIQRTGTIAEQRGLGTGRAKIATELASPIGPTAARQYNVSPTTTLQELQNTVGLSDIQKDRVYAVGQIDTLMADIDTLLPQVFPNVAPGIKGNLQTMLSLGIQKFSKDDDLAALDAAINASLAQIAQLSGQPGSRLSDKDLELAKSTLVNLTPSIFNGDTLATARARVGIIKQLLEKAKGSIPTSPQIGGPPPAAGAARGVGAAPPSAATSGGPAGWFVVDGKLVNKGASASAP